MSIRQRAYPTGDQAGAMRTHCAHARYVWDLALEQANMWCRDKTLHGVHAPNNAARMRQLTEARAQREWLREGSTVVQQGALRDFDKAMSAWWGGSHRKPRWRKEGRNDGFVIRDLSMKRLGRRWGAVLVPKVGWVKFRATYPWDTITAGTSAQVTYRHGQWHVSFTTTRKPAPKPDPEEPGAFLPNRARAKAGLNRAILTSCWGRLADRLRDNLPDGQLVSVDPRNTSRQCAECGHTSRENRESPAVFSCHECGHAAHADTNAARNILARAVQQNPRASGDRAHQSRKRAASTTPAAAAAKESPVRQGGEDVKLIHTQPGLIPSHPTPDLAPDLALEPVRPPRSIHQVVPEGSRAPHPPQDWIPNRSLSTATTKLSQVAPTVGMHDE